MANNKDTVELVCSIAELSSMFEESHSLDEFLDAVVRTVAAHMRAAVCSIYLFDSYDQTLVLRATQGLNRESIGQIRLKMGEGLCGVALKELRPIRKAVASQSRHFIPVPGSFEEQYEAFLVVPILRGLKRVGVLVVQDGQPDYFTKDDARALQAIASQLAGTIENAQLLLSLRELHEESSPEAPVGGHYKGRAVSPGVVLGPASVWSFRSRGGQRLEPAAPSGAGLVEFRDAIRRSEHQLITVQRETEESLGHEVAMIFSAQQLLLRDEQIEGDMLRRIETGRDAGEVVAEVFNEYIQLFAASDMEMLREKVHDLKDLGHRMLRNLSSEGEDDVGDYHGHIVISAEFLPSDVVKLVAQRVAGLVMVGGGMTSHASILARALGVPLVIVEDDGVLHIRDDSLVLLDGIQGSLLVAPDAEVVESYRSLLEHEAGEGAGPVQHETTHTKDGTRITLSANINLMGEVALAWTQGAEGIGLYRSEFPFLIRNDFPSEEEQLRIYLSILEQAGERDVVFRTLDIGADKLLSYLPAWNEANPALGLRSIRFSLKNRPIFAQQLRAMLRAGAGRPLKIMFPLVSSLEELRAAKGCVAESIHDLCEQGIHCNTEPELGIMVETPAAVELIDALARESDFLSIGTNDLLQYLLAVDRTNEHVADLYIDHHPAIFRSIRKVIDAAKRANIPLSLCGEMAAHPRIVPILIGMGLRSLSIEPRSVGAVQAVIMALDLAEAETKAAAVLRSDEIGQTLALL
ncbi:MAG: phosphoenolpyruvate--protein phosphotransferase [Lentisphaerae bacterium]|nr:phosphoenolpyruvate--protein phosphotransferase [Lentisphaerota bacterium]